MAQVPTSADSRAATAEAAERSGDFARAERLYAQASELYEQAHDQGRARVMAEAARTASAVAARRLAE